jgi:YVTN family beta-propeller protein
MRHPTRLLAAALMPVAALSACSRAAAPGAPPARQGRAPDLDAAGRLPTGLRLDPEGTLLDVGNFPLAMTLTPDGRHALLLLSGWREQGLQLVDRTAGRVAQTVSLPASFLGLAIAPDGETVYASGGFRDVIYRFGLAGDALTLRDSIALEPTPPDSAGTSAGGRPRPAHTVNRHFPAGLALAPDGRTLYVAENLSDDLAVVDPTSGNVLQRLPTELYPYAVVVAADGRVYVSAWGGRTVSVFRPASGGRLEEAGRIEVGRHPSALALSQDGARLFVASGSTDRVAVVDTRAGRVLTELLDPPPAGPGEGSTPDGLALASDGARLFVAEGDANAVAVFELSAATAGKPTPYAQDRLAGRIPAGWYPAGVAVRGDTLLVLNAKGRGSQPDPGRLPPGRSQPRGTRNYTLAQIDGTLQTLVPPAAGAAGVSALARASARVARANGWNGPGTLGQAGYPPIEHVVYIIKENRTYDQVLGDVPGGDGDTAIVFFGRAITPNHHALAERFGLFDRFFTNAEVSADGHNWSVGAYATDYVQKTVPSNYSSRGRDYDYEGENRGHAVAGDADPAEPAPGYLWDAAARAGIAFRNYGEFVRDVKAADGSTTYVGNKPFLAAHTDPTFPGWDLDIPDQKRADEWIRELHEFERTGSMPALEIMRLPNDHTAGGEVSQPTPRAFVADNDLALGRVIEALSRSAFWKSSVVFVLEDDAQDGPDHVDSHRSPVLVISPWSRGGVQHRFANTTDVLATIADLLKLEPLSQFQYFGRPLRDAFGTTPDLRPYTALTPSIPLAERNTAMNPGARQSRSLRLAKEDASDDDNFNRILWTMMKGDRPYPGRARASALELRR